MKKIASIALALAVAIAAASAQERDYIYTNPVAPPRDALERLNLKTGWTAVVDTESKRDGIATIQLTGRLLLIQTRSGLVTALDAENGQTRWRTRVGRSYQRVLPLAFNRKSVFVVNGTNIYGLDRETGGKSWEMNLPEGVTSPPVAGDFQLYIGFSTGRLSAYLLPAGEQAAGGAGSSSEMASYLRGEELEQAYPSGTTANLPLLAWQTLTRARLEWAPVMGPAGIMYASPTGEVFTYEKFPIKERRATQLYRYQLTDGPIPVSLGQYEGTAYIGATDSNLYAVNIDTGAVNWRFTAGTTILRRPIATEKDVFVVAEKLGLARLDRLTGDPVWRLPRGNVTYPANQEAVRFLAANPKFVYANDAAGRLLVLDRQTGIRLSSYEAIRDFPILLSNGINDRLYLGANNGLIVCLHDRDYPVPFRHVRGEERAIDPQQAEVETKLDKLITDPGQEPAAISTVLKDLLGEKNGNIKFLISENAFKEAGMFGFEDRKAAIPKVTSVPLRDVLRRVLASVDATYQVIKDTVLVYPLTKKATP
jgi:outer membrane protein assembly factor BamB